MNAQTNMELQKKITSHLSESAPHIQFLIGPRQVGKTTLVEILAQGIKKRQFLIFSADGVSDANFLERCWQRAQLEKKILVIDEVQKLPNWSEALKKHWDRGPKIKCLFLGSSSLDLQVGIQESLTGRFEVILVSHWDFKNSKIFKKSWSLQKHLLYGGYPGSYKFLADQERWISYMRNSIVETVIGKDILMQARVKSPSLFRQAFYMLASHPAQIISYNKLLGQIQDKGNVELIKYYIRLFEGAFLMKSIQKYSINELRKQSSSPKIIILAPALSTFHKFDQLTSEYLGRVFESLVGAQLLKSFPEIFYWAEGDFEVDYVFSYKKLLIALEVKSDRPRKAISLEKFLAKHPKARAVFITKENYVEFEKSPRLFLDQVLGL
jgi:predicted AAA+ superfamily ATPase